MNQVSRIFFCIWLLFFADPASAYFQTKHPSENIRIDHTTSAPPTQDNIAYLLYDNTYSNQDGFFENNNLGSYFIHLDRIQIDLPLRLLKKNYVYDDQSIDRLLAANLKLKNIIDDYRSLNRKAETLLGDFKQNRTPPKNSNPDSIDIKKHADQVSDERKKLIHIMENMGRYDSSLLMERINDEVVVSADPAHVGSKRQPPIEQLSMGNEKHLSGSRTTNILDSNYTSKNSRSNTLGKKEKLPWIFEVFLKAINYAVKNRVEILLYAIFVLLAGFLISLKAQK